MKQLAQAPPVVWSIAGSDPGGGAGVQADMKALAGLGVYGCGALTAVIAQNTRGVRRVEPVRADLLFEQLEALAEDMPPEAVKIGLVSTPEQAEALGRFLETRRPPFVVVDPVLASGAGEPLAKAETIEVLKRRLFPHTDLITPNRSEAEALAGCAIRTEADLDRAGHMLLETGAHAVLIKGGHFEGAYSADAWRDRHAAWRLVLPRLALPRGVHGTGCAFSSCVAACVARGSSPIDAALLAKAYVRRGMREAPALGKGRAPFAHGGFPDSPDDTPWAVPHGAPIARGAPFPPCRAIASIYPLTDRADRIRVLAEAGATVAQIRIKDLGPTDREREIAAACAIARRTGLALYVNDDWSAAIRHKAHGCHLGQDDLSDEALRALRAAGLRLGISTHNVFEIARAEAYAPSYLAIGTVFESPSKHFEHRPLGVEAFARLRRLTARPVVAIGGIDRKRAPGVRAAGADGIAVISDLAGVADPRARLIEWKALFSGRTG